jgi:predicted amidophosphoribosyltransferase
VGLLKKEREKNLKSIFKYNGVNLSGKRILLLDDVTTTGTTLNECAKILRKKGALEVIGAVIAKE